MPAAPRALPAALASAAAVGLQVLLPRLFSVVLWSHLGFFAVSLAMLGFAAAGVRVARRPAVDLARASALAGLTTTAALVVVLRLPVDPTVLLESLTAPLLLLLMGLALAVPFLFLGTVVCGALAAEGERPGRVYGASFAGGAAGALLCLAAMEWWGAPRAAGLLALLPLAGAVVAGWAEAAPPRAALFGGATLAVLALAAPDHLLPFVSRKHFPAVPPEAVIEQRWNAFSHVTFYDNPDHHGLWALPPDYRGPLPRTIGAAIDTWAITPIVERRPGADRHPVLERYPPSLFYVGAQPGFTALVIGAGGGIDVQAALAAGASHVTAVEINPLIVDAVRGRFAEFCGGLYDDPRVEVIVAEGRDYLERAAVGAVEGATRGAGGRTWDRIVLSGVDTFAATEAGAFALSENHLYTVEGVAAALRCLTPDGVLAYTRWWFEPPRQTIRLVLTVAQVLRAQGESAPGPHVFVGVADRNSLLLVGRRRFTDAELETLQAAAQRRGMAPVYAQNAPSHPLFVQALALPDTSALIAGYPYRIDPATDDSPFFFEYGRLSGLFATEGDWIRDRLGGQEVLLASLVVLLLLCVPLLLLARGGPGATAASGLSRRERAGLVLLGAGYLLVEIPVMQRLALVLGHPVLAVAVVLVALLLLSGLGARWSDRVAPRRLPLVAALVAAAVVAALVLANDAFVTTATMAGAGRAARTAAAVALLAAPGVLMGLPFPLALRRLAERGGDDGATVVPAAFAWNGAASVLASPLAVLLAMQIGFRATLLVAAACYAAAALTWRKPANAI